MEDVIIIGAGGHARVVADIVSSMGDRVLGFLDDRPDAAGAYGIPVLGKVDDYIHYPHARFLIGIGSSAVRQKLDQRLSGVRWHTAIHPGAKIGRHCILNSGSIVEHDDTIGDYVHISVGAKLAGTVTVGDHTWVGIGAVISNDISVCGGCMLGAGTVVVKNIEDPGTYVGVPARRIK